MELSLGENLKRMRKSRNITQEELAEILGVTFQSVSRWERGDCYPDITLLPGLANFFDVSVDALLGMAALDEAVTLCERVLKCRTNEKVRSTTRSNVCYLYTITGRLEKAVMLARTLPHIWECRELLLPDLLEGPESIKSLKSAISLILAVLCDKTDPVSTCGNKTKRIKNIALGPPAADGETAGMLEKLAGFMEG
jgi:transcriptional regulator with XRE-family HTH domain